LVLGIKKARLLGGLERNDGALFIDRDDCENQQMADET
jgi:hypothetical protein